MEVDFLLVGQGVAGTLLSYRLIEGGKRVHVIDQPQKNTCSRVAAGLFNPVTGRNLVKTWNADIIFPEIVPLYTRLEKELKVKFLHKRRIYRPFTSLTEQNDWMGRSSDEAFKPYINGIKSVSDFPEVHDPMGGLYVGQAGYVDMPVLLDRYARWLEERGQYSGEAFEEKELVFTESAVRYREIHARSLVFVNGMEATKSRFFTWLPLIPNKGEILVVKQSFLPSEIINRGVFRISLSDNTVRVGSTYNVRDLEPMPTEVGKKEILYRLEKLVHPPVEEVLEHAWGIRPTVSDRRPVLGKHPEVPDVYIFNGLGTKGVSLAPYYSKMMFNYLIFGNEPPEEVNLRRFFKYI
ncbi:MAG TPA: FAD-dependent oxidoreductase [Cyclobacteriaceae bacterium]|nr:FAD-dependent oxidoreductase [Cyclobacteriaceae bacterium]